MWIPAYAHQTSNWTPLINLVGKDRAQSFMLISNCEEIMIYKHSVTRRFLNIHIASGQTYRYCGEQVYLPIDPEVAIDSALGLSAAKRRKRTTRSL